MTEKISIPPPHLDDGDTAFDLAQVVVDGGHRLLGHPPLPLVHRVRVQP
jgi:hypothetical protein